MIKPSARCHDTCKPITASEECHCILCHQSFYTVESFEKHREDPETLENDCWHPEDCGLIFEKEMWASPFEHQRRKMYEDRLEKAREARGK